MNVNIVHVGPVFFVFTLTNPNTLTRYRFRCAWRTGGHRLHLTELRSRRPELRDAWPEALAVRDKIRCTLLAIDIIKRRLQGADTARPVQLYKEDKIFKLFRSKKYRNIDPLVRYANKQLCIGGAS